MKSVANELEKHWLHIVHHNICIPSHQIITGNEHEKVVYTKTKFLSDKIAIKNSALREIEGVDTFRVEGTDMLDVHLNERKNVVLPDNVKNTLTNSCDIDASCSSSTSTINALPATSTGRSNSNGLSSREANAICIVLGEISPLLQKYDNGKTMFKGLQKEKANVSINYKDDLLNIQSILQQQVIRKLSDLRREFECWEIFDNLDFFLVK